VTVIRKPDRFEGIETMDNQVQLAVIDGVSAIASHNGVHRIMCFRLSMEGKPEPALELVVPPGAAAALADAFRKIRG
jgi:hypothetical protein